MMTEQLPHTPTHLTYINITLREWNFNMIIIESLINGFFDICSEDCFLIDKYPHNEFEVHTVITKICKSHSQRFLYINHGLMFRILLCAKRLYRFNNNVSNFVHI